MKTKGPWAFPFIAMNMADDGGATEGTDPGSGEVAEHIGEQSAPDQAEPSAYDSGQTGAETEPKSSDPGWRRIFPKEYQQDEFFQQYTSAKEALLDLKGKVLKSKDAVVKPGEGATEGEIAEYRKAMGIPDRPEDYHLPKPEGFPEEIISDEWFRNAAHEIGLSKDQAEKVYAQYYQNMAEQLQTQKAEKLQKQKKAVEEMQREYGGEYDAKLTQGKRAVQEIGGADFAKFLEESGLGDDPRMIRAAIRMGELIGEDSLVAGRVSTPLAGDRHRDPGTLNIDYSDYFGG